MILFWLGTVALFFGKMKRVWQLIWQMKPGHRHESSPFQTVAKDNLTLSNCYLYSYITVIYFAKIQSPKGQVCSKNGIGNDDTSHVKCLSL